MNSYYFKIKKVLNNPFYISRTIYSIIVFLVLYFGFSLYKYFELKTDKKCFNDLYELLERYEGALNENADVPIKELIHDAELLYKKNNNSSLSPYFSLIKNASLEFLEEEKVNDFEKNFSKLKVGLNLKLLNKICLSLILLNNDKQKDGEDLIRFCISQKNDPFHELAIYYYGLYLLQNKSLEDADYIWNIIEKDPKYKDSIFLERINLARNWNIVVN